MIIRIDHKGEDYYGVEFNGTYGEVYLSEGEIIKSAMKIIEAVVMNTIASNTIKDRTKKIAQRKGK